MAEAAPADEVRLDGELTFASVPAKAQVRPAWLKPGAVHTVDLSGVTRADSAGLALVLDWLAQARAGGGDLKLTRAPDQLLAIARASGLTDLFESPEG